VNGEADVCEIKNYILGRKMEFEKKNYIITGAGNGVGKALAIEFSQKGANTILIDIDKKALNETFQQIQKQKYICEMYVCDITKSDQVKKLFKSIIKKYETISGLIHCADNQKYQISASAQEKDFDKHLQPHLKGLFITTNEIKDHLINQKHGKIVTLASFSGLIGLQKNALYSAINGGVLSYVKGLAVELSPQNINVNSVTAGIIATPTNKNLLDDKKTKQEILKNIPLKRIGTPTEVVSAILFLLSSNADFITGQNIVVDGGLLTH
jgi:3-oxoacyl-[acyl-carrier protein] reductase